MTEINPAQLAFLLQIKTEDANKKIYFCLHKAGKIVSPYDEDKRYSIEVDLWEKVSEIKIKEAISDIANNYMKRAATRGYLMDLPQKKLSSKAYFDGCSVSIPNPLRSMLSEETIAEVAKRWEERYAGCKIVLKP